MTQIVSAHFDGKVIVLDEPVELPVGTPLRIQVELQDAATSADKTSAEPAARETAQGANGESPRFAGLLNLAADLPDAPVDLAAQHDHYLYGSPKR